MLTDSYKILKEGSISLSGKSTGIDGVGADVISTLTGGDALVEFKPICDKIKKEVSDKFGKEYIENEEAFIIKADDIVTVYADTPRAKLFAACSIKDKYTDGKMRCGLWWSYPSVSHRSLRVFLPPKKDLQYFYKLIDMLVHMGYNSILLEICGAMEFKRHPEINEGWLKYCASINESPEKYHLATNGYYRVKNSIHTCNAGGGVYSQEEMKEIVNYCKERFIEIVPEVPSLSHSEYILVSHPELRECDDEPYAAEACPSNPDLNKLVFDLYDEVIDVFGCKALHIGHDEWWVMCVCDKCKGKNPVDLYVNNVMESYNYLKSKGIKTYMWADKLKAVKDKKGEWHGAARKDVYAVPTKKEPKTINVMGENHPLYDIYWFKAPQWVKEEGFHHVIESVEGCSSRLPSDITYCNWYYAYDTDIGDNVFSREGKDMILGNAVPSCINNYKERFLSGTQGISVSNWAETSEYNMQQWGVPYQLGYGSVICWNHERTEADHKENVFDAFNGLYELNNRETIEGSHLEVEYRMAKEWKGGKKGFDSMAMLDTDALTLGNYEVTYADGTKDLFPVMFNLNISYGDIKFVRTISADSYAYAEEGNFNYTASACNITGTAGDIWYKTVLAIKEGAVKCEYIPKEGMEDYVTVKRLEIKNV